MFFFFPPSVCTAALKKQRNAEKVEQRRRSRIGNGDDGEAEAASAATAAAAAAAAAADGTPGGDSRRAPERDPFDDLFELGAIDAAVSALDSEHLLIRRAAARLLSLLLRGGCGMVPLAAATPPSELPPNQTSRLLALALPDADRAAVNTSVAFGEDTLSTLLQALPALVLALRDEDEALKRHSYDCVMRLCSISLAARDTVIEEAGAKVLTPVLRELVADAANRRGAVAVARGANAGPPPSLPVLTILHYISQRPTGREDLLEEGTLDALRDCAMYRADFPLEISMCTKWGEGVALVFIRVLFYNQLLLRIHTTKSH
jgi:hypothetical protein